MKAHGQQKEPPEGLEVHEVTGNSGRRVREENSTDTARSPLKCQSLVLRQLFGLFALPNYFPDRPQRIAQDRQE